MRVGDGYTVTMTKVNTYVTPTGAQTANHSHGLSGITANHTHAFSGGTGGPSGGSDAAYSGDTDTRGSSPTNTNLPPYVGMAYIMRII